jgi:hypothetical protein
MSERRPLFRIERKETLEQRLKEKKKLTALQEVTADSISIGTRSNADLVLKDPIAASRHCSIAFKMGKFVLCDGDNATGTFLNGARIESDRVLRPGDRIALGVTTIEWPPSDEAEGPGVITLHVREGAFFFAMKRRGEFESDTDEWVRSEVTFGRMPLLRALNVLGIVAAIGAALWLWLAPKGQETLQPGHLSSAHAALFSNHPPTDAHLASAVAIAQEMKCAACHESFGQPSQAKCAACHGELVEAAAATLSHPFGWDDASRCSSCHREHYGATPPPGALHPVDISQDCQDCHGDLFDTEAGLREGLARAVEEYDLAPSTDESVQRVASMGFEGFHHGDHSSVNDCAACHVESESFEHGDFAKQNFDSCMVCHSPSSEASSTVLADWLPPAESRWDLDWHGSGTDGSHCQQCHVEPYAAALKETETLHPSAVLFSLQTRSHAHDFEVSTDPADCASCHKAGLPRNAGRTMKSRAFRHDQHLSFPRPTSEEEARVNAAQCAECHTDMALSAQLVASPGSYLGPPAGSCASCHEEDGRSLIEGPGTPAEPLAPASTVAFPHAQHVEVEGGCLACHAVPVDSSQRVATIEGAAQCASCHVETSGDLSVAHHFLAGAGADGCAVCHTSQSDPASGRAMASVFYAEADAAMGRSTFSHTLEAHKQGSCTDCHGDLTAGEDIYSPPESAASCRECHARSRFHWR